MYTVSLSKTLRARANWSAISLRRYRSTKLESAICTVGSRSPLPSLRFFGDPIRIGVALEAACNRFDGSHLYVVVYYFELNYMRIEPIPDRFGNRQLTLGSNLGRVRHEQISLPSINENPRLLVGQASGEWRSGLAVLHSQQRCGHRTRHTVHAGCPAIFVSKRLYGRMSSAVGVARLAVDLGPQGARGGKALRRAVRGCSSVN